MIRQKLFSNAIIQNLDPAATILLFTFEGYVSGSPNLPEESGSSGVRSNSGDSYVFLGDTKVWSKSYIIFVLVVIYKK